MHTGPNYPKNKMFAKLDMKYMCVCIYVGPHYSNDKMDKL